VVSDRDSALLLDWPLLGRTRPTPSHVRGSYDDVDGARAFAALRRRGWRVRGYSPAVARHMVGSHRWVAVLVLGLSYEPPVVCRFELVRHFAQR